MFLAVMYLCNALSCQKYIVDTASSMDDCETNLTAHSNSTALYWSNDKKANSEGFKWWLGANDIHLSKAELESIVDYDYSCLQE